MTDYTKRLYVDDEAEIGRLQSAIEQLTAKLAEAIRQRDEARAALAQTVPQSVYESAVKGRQDFRDALRKARAELNECQPYLKERETVAECIARNRKDVVSVLEMLTKDRIELDRLRAELAEANRQAQWPPKASELLAAAEADNRALRELLGKCECAYAGHEVRSTSLHCTCVELEAFRDAGGGK